MLYKNVPESITVYSVLKVVYTLRPYHEKQSFIRNLKHLVHQVEDKKIELCHKISNWNLEAECYEKIMVEVPKNPFDINSGTKLSSLYGHELRTIFVENVWDAHVHQAIKSAISNLLRSPDNYGRGYVSLIVPPPTPNPKNKSQSKTKIRIKPDELGIVFTAIENVATLIEIAAIAAAPFTGGASLAILVPVGIVGSIPTGYRLYNSGTDSTFDLTDPGTILDLVDVIGW